MSGYVDHGWRHGPGGTDPVPFPPATGAGGAYRNPVMRYAVGGPEWKMASLYDNGVSGWRVVDTASPFGGYIEINGDTKYFVMGAPLGPKGSTWAINMAYRTATDGGRVVFDWQTTRVDGLFTGYGYGAGPFVESVEGPETYTSTYYKANSSTTFHQDFYSATPADVYSSFYAPIRIGGVDDAMLSADGTAVTNNPWSGALTQREMNGGGDGSVMWWLRVRISGRNASNTTGYKARIYYLAIARVENTTGKIIG